MLAAFLLAGACEFDQGGIAPDRRSADGGLDTALEAGISVASDGPPDSPPAPPPRDGPLADAPVPIDLAGPEAGLPDAPPAADLEPTCPPQCPPRPPVALRINVNGPAHGAFTADPGIGGVCAPNPYGVDRPINGTADDPLYNQEMFGNPLTCVVGAGQLPPGPYEVVLHMAEIYWGPTCPGGSAGPGSRVFDIEVEGQVLASAVDLYAEVGCAASSDGSGGPVIKRFRTEIRDGSLDLRFTASKDNGKISAIEVLSDF